MMKEVLPCKTITVEGSLCKHEPVTTKPLPLAYSVLTLCAVCV